MLAAPPVPRMKTGPDFLARDDKWVVPLAPRAREPLVGQLVNAHRSTSCNGVEHFHAVSFGQLGGWPFVSAHQFGVDGHGDSPRPTAKGADHVGDRRPLGKLERLTVHVELHGRSVAVIGGSVHNGSYPLLIGWLADAEPLSEKAAAAPPIARPESASKSASAVSGASRIPLR